MTPSISRAQISQLFRNHSNLRTRSPRDSVRRLKTPRSIKLVSALRRNTLAKDEPNFEGLLKKQWKMYSVSPLFNLKHNRAALTRYARSLDVALSQAQRYPLGNSGSLRSNFSVYKDLSFNGTDPPALRIQVMEQNIDGVGSKVVLEAFLLCVEPELSPLASDVRDHFTYYPIALVAGNKSRTDILLSWLESHFDCRSDPLNLSDEDLRYLLALSSAFISDKKSPPVLLQYSLSEVCDGLDHITSYFEPQGIKDLWEQLFVSPRTKPELFDEDVHKFVNHIEQILEHMMGIKFQKLPLSEVGTSLAYVSHLGKIKIFSPSVIYPILHLLCMASNERFMLMSPLRS